MKNLQGTTLLQKEKLMEWMYGNISHFSFIQQMSFIKIIKVL